jgi:hypothetical protein
MEVEKRLSMFSTNYLAFKTEKVEDIGPSKRDGMTEKHIRAYSVCHYYNDMNACIYQVYKSLYLVQVIQLELSKVGWAYLIG